MSVSDTTSVPVMTTKLSNAVEDTKVPEPAPVPAFPVNLDPTIEKPRTNAGFSHANEINFRKWEKYYHNADQKIDDYLAKHIKRLEAEESNKKVEAEKREKVEAAAAEKLRVKEAKKNAGNKFNAQPWQIGMDPFDRF